jgi:uncharacterized membrane protein YhaH (DUF805 family)
MFTTKGRDTRFEFLFFFIFYCILFILFASLLGVIFSYQLKDNPKFEQEKKQAMGVISRNKKLDSNGVSAPKRNKKNPRPLSFEEQWEEENFRSLSFEEKVIFSILGLGFLLLLLLVSMASIRRLHDMDESGFFSLFLLNPAISGIFLAILFFKKGTDRPNIYGPDPLLEPPLQ